MKILLDGDGCVFDMLSAVQQIQPAFCPEAVIDYNMEHSDCGISQAEFLQIASRPETLLVQGLYPGVKKDVADLLKLGQVIGWSGVSPANREGRIRQFQELGVCQVDAEKQFHPDADVVIDDAVDQLMQFGQKTQKFLITRRYNQDQVLPGDIERVKDLREVIERLTERNIHRI